MNDAAPPPAEPDSAHLTVLEALTSKLGAVPKLSLEDEGSEEGGSPVVKPAPDAARAALPGGRGNHVACATRRARSSETRATAGSERPVQ